MKTNDIKKGMRIQMANGWKGTMMDNVKGNTRMAEIEGFETEIGSVYAHDIMWVVVDNKAVKVEHTDKQLQLKEQINLMFH